MWQFIFRRSVLLVITLLGVVLITFFISRTLPSDPVMLLVGEHPTTEQIEVAKHELGLDKPLIYQFAVYLKNLIHGELGLSLRTKQPITLELSKRFAATFELVTLSILVGILAGFPLGILSAFYNTKFWANLMRFLSFASIALPVFWSGLLLQMLFFGKLGWLPLQGRIGMEFGAISLPVNSGVMIIDTVLSGRWFVFLDVLKHLALPVVCLSFSCLGIIVRTVRSAMLETITEDHFTTYRAYGFRTATLLFRVVLKNSLVLSITVIGLVYGMLLGGSFLVESIFDWPGLGQFGVLSILTADFPAVMGVTLLYAATYVLINFIVDISYHYVDPRIRYGSA